MKEIWETNFKTRSSALPKTLCEVSRRKILKRVSTSKLLEKLKELAILKRELERLKNIDDKIVSPRRNY